MVDLGHAQTDEVLESLEERLAGVYSQAYEDVKKKADDYFARFAVKDKAKRDLVATGKLSKAEYSTWRRNQMLSGKRWTDLRDQLAQDLTNTNKIAAAMVRGELNEVFAINANYSEYLIENGMRMNYGFTLYDRNTVANLVMNDPDIIPWKPEVDVAADLRWNRQMITSHITQGILQGESIPNLSKRLLKTVNNDKVAAVRTARTAVTSSQNAGRQMVYNKAKSMGLNLQKEWLATLDGRTRHDHGMADGQRVALDGKFVVGGYKMEYPGDMSAPDWLVYNCRCTTITVEPDYITKGEEPRQTYSEWIEEKKKANQSGLGEEYTGPDGIVPFNKKLMDMDASLFGSVDVVNSNIQSEYDRKFGSVKYLHSQFPDEYPMVDYEAWLKMDYRDQVNSLPSFESFRKYSLDKEPWKYAESGSLVDGFNRYNIGATPDGYGKGKGMRLVFDEEFGLSRFIDTNPSIQYNGDTIYRGVKSSKSGINDLRKAMENGTPVSMRGPSSWSTKEYMAVDFTKYSLRGTSKSLPVVFVEEGNFKRQAMPFPYSSTGFQPQYEVLYSGTPSFKVLRMEEKGGVTYVYVKSE